MLTFKGEGCTLNKVILMVLLTGLVVLSLSEFPLSHWQVYFSTSYCHEVSTLAELVVTLNSVRLGPK